MHPFCCQRDRPYPHTHQLVNHIVDCRAACRPQALFAEYPRSPTSFEDGFHKVTYGQLARAIDLIAHWLVQELGVSKEFETLAYIGPNDIRYPALVLGAIKAGYKILLLSSRNSAAAQLHLMRATNCTKLLTPVQKPPSATEVVANQDSENVTFHEVPTLEEVLNAQCPPFPYMKTLEEAASDPFVIMHTSGSTGLPKPVIWPQSFVPALAKQWQLDTPEDMDSIDHLYHGNRAYIVFPPFHAAYAAHVYINGICNQTSIIFPLSGTIPSAVQLSEALKHTTVDVAFLVPVIVEEMSNSPELLESISSRLDRICYSGGDLPRGCGDRVASKVELIAFYGTTEFAHLALIKPRHKTRSDWKYSTFHPQACVEFQKYADDMYELVIIRKPDCERHQPIFVTFPDRRNYHTKDLFVQHPTKPNLWTHCGRSDDIVVFLTGEKTNPVPYEQIVFARHAEIDGILLIGAQKFQAALLIELTSKDNVQTADRETLVKRFWPSIELANESCADHARVAPTHVWFTDPKRPMIRSPKGTIQRAATLKEYADYIELWYQQAEGNAADAGSVLVFDRNDTSALTKFIREEVHSITGFIVQDNENFFISGMQSLQALMLSRNIRLKLGDPKFGVTTIYNSPSISELVTSIQEQNAKTSTLLKSTKSGQDEMDSMLRKLCTKIDGLPYLPSRPEIASPSTRPLSIILTGSTGSLGAHILDDLLKNPDVAHVYCLNRAIDGGVAQQLARRLESNSGAEYDPARVTFLSADLSKVDLGLKSMTLSSLNACVDVCIHNAWSVNFNTPLSAFEPQLEGMVNLMGFCNTAAKRPSITYLSSVSSVNYLPDAMVSETVIHNYSAPSPMGYGRSKYIGEQILERGSNRLGIPVSILRVGQVAGPAGVSQAKWNRKEWFPSLVASSNYVRALPQSLPGMLERIDWVPVDVLSKVVIEISTREHGAASQSKRQEVVNVDNNTAGRKSQSSLATQCEVYNIVNPHPVAWSARLSGLVSTITTHDGPPSLVPFEKWLEIVRSRSSQEGSESDNLAVSHQRNPAAMLLDFFEESQNQNQIPKWETNAALRVSQNLRSLEEVSSQWIDRWSRAWLE